MEISATVQARNDVKGESNRPSARRINDLADELRRRGFNVHRAGRFGVSVTAEDSHYRKVLGVDPVHPSAAWQPVSENSELADLAEAVEITPQPIPFGG